MSSAISSTSSAADLAAQAPAHPASATASQGSGKSQEQSALRQLVSQYSADIHQGQSAASLNALANRITAAARTAGTTVVLPTASSGASEPTDSGQVVNKTA